MILYGYISSDKFFIFLLDEIDKMIWDNNINFDLRLNLGQSYRRNKLIDRDNRFEGRALIGDE